MENILETIKKMLNIDNDDNVFDDELLVHINGALAHLCQLGIGDENGFIANSESKWNEFIDMSTYKYLTMVEQFVYLKTKVIWDPPTSSYTLDAMNNQLKEYEWRLNVAVDPGPEEEESASSSLFGVNNIITL